MSVAVAEEGQDMTCRVAVSSNGDSLGSEVVPIGRSTHFIVFEGSPENFRSMRNEARGKGSDSGVEVAKLLRSKGISIVITGTLGKSGFQALDKAGIVIHAGCTGKVGDIIQKCLNGELPKCKGATYTGYIGF